MDSPLISFFINLFNEIIIEYKTGPCPVEFRKNIQVIEQICIDHSRNEWLKTSIYIGI